MSDFKIIDGLVVGLKLPDKLQIESQLFSLQYIKPESRKQYDPREVPFKIGQIVSKSIVRPADLNQLWVVIGLSFGNGDYGWKATIARKGTIEFHRNSIYSCSASSLRVVE